MRDAPSPLGEGLLFHRENAGEGLRRGGGTRIIAGKDQLTAGKGGGHHGKDETTRQPGAHRAADLRRGAADPLRAAAASADLHHPGPFGPAAAAGQLCLRRAGADGRGLCHLDLLPLGEPLLQAQLDVPAASRAGGGRHPLLPLGRAAPGQGPQPEEDRHAPGAERHRSGQRDQPHPAGPGAPQLGKGGRLPSKAGFLALPEYPRPLPPGRGSVL